MKIFNWNVRNKNRKIYRGISWILEQNPDVVCLQEVPGKVLTKLTKDTKMYINYVIDFESKTREEKNIYNVVLTKIPPKKIESFTYFEEEESTFYGRILYNKINKVSERHKGISITLESGKIKINVINVHLSCSIGSRKRLLQIKNTLRKTEESKLNLICGDFNVMSNKILKRTAGKKVGYTKEDYRIEEKREANALFENFNLSNIFQKKVTTSFAGSKIVKLQPDHILLDKRIEVIEHKMLKSFGSDHRILFVEIKI